MANVGNTRPEANADRRPPPRSGAWRGEDVSRATEKLRAKAERSVPHHLHTASIMGQTLHGWLDEVLNLQAVARIQAAVYLAIGIWSLFNISTLVALAGPHIKPWIMQSVGASTVMWGLTLGAFSLSRTRRSSVFTLGLAMAVTAGVATVGLVAINELGRVYLSDAALEGAFAAWWLGARWHERTLAKRAKADGGDAQRFSDVASQARLH